MSDTLLSTLRQKLPAEIADLVEPYLTKLEQGNFEAILRDEEAQLLFGLGTNDDAVGGKVEGSKIWTDFIFQRLGSLTADRSKPERQYSLFCIGYAALLAFVQLNVTGPPLPFSSTKMLFGAETAGNKQKYQAMRSALLASLSLDGVAAYKLTPGIELLCLSDAIMTAPAILKNVPMARWAKMRVEFVHQRLLSEVSPTLQRMIYDDMDTIEDEILGRNGDSSVSPKARDDFLLERAAIHTHHGQDKQARADLEKAKIDRGFEFALTGLLGKRTKFQQKDISQLVVLARSKADNEGAENQITTSGGENTNGASATEGASRPEDLDLNDDTLLEKISFTKKGGSTTDYQEASSLPPAIAELDPENQPQLNPLDSCILLALASSITNTQPEHGLTREETLPYATRVLEGGSSNWQVYTQALLVRSRIEGFRSRTVERGLLQLQALVDQLIADTSTAETAELGAANGSAGSTFLPRAKETESAPVNERLRFAFQLASPTRWALEAELAARWVSLGGLKSALDIYERLEMWAEAALCWAATEREDKAKRIVRRQLFHATNGGPDTPEEDAGDDEEWLGPERQPAPLDAPRLYCILGDLAQDTDMFEKAWEVSGQRYARAQRSLGRHYLTTRDFVKAAGGYSKSLTVDQLNESSWFALGCALLELAQFDRAVEAFTRCVQLVEDDAEAWSNLAAALLRTEPSPETHERANDLSNNQTDTEDSLTSENPPDPQQPRLDALKALKRAAALKHDSPKIWQNVLIVAASLSPPDYMSILTAQQRIIKLRGSVEGESCVDVQILTLLVRHLIASSEGYDPETPGLTRMAVKFIDQSVVPLITASADLWRLVAQLTLWRKKPSSALEAEEKAWRAVLAQPGWEYESEERWEGVVEATVRLCDAYESLGPQERTEGLGAGELVAKDWKFKARSAVRGVMSKGRDSWDGTKGWERLEEVMEELKA
ncbi:hypothetical protein MBLNU230_g5151t1 [Neophaeotheca triangularis]